MCGINGIISLTLNENDILLKLEKMGTLLKHRGPDDQRESVFFCAPSYVGLGFRRLSILDLETGMQPVICNEDKSAIICNGQVYNYVELKPLVSENIFTTKGDSEVALHLYRKYGLDFLGMLNGMYAGAIFDPVNKKLVLFRDRFGIKPLYYCIREGSFFFSSEIKPLLKGSGMPAELNESKLAAFFTYRYVPGSETMFKGIKRIPPGSFLEYDLRKNQYTLKRYWEYRLDDSDSGMDIDTASEQFIELFRDSVRIRMRSDVEVGALISGGIDSSAVASLSASHKPDIRLFTVFFDEEKYNELPLVKNFLSKNPDRFKHATLHTQQCGIESLNRLPSIVESLEEPVSLGTIIPTDQVCRTAGERVKVVMTGEGADEIFAGYRKYLLEMAAHNYPSLSRASQNELKEIYPELEAYMSVRDSNPAVRYIQSEILFSKPELKALLGTYTDEDFPQDALPFLSGREHPLNAMIAMETKARLPDYVILRLDKLSMRHSLETRTPFLDYRLAEFAAGLPVDFKANLESQREKYLCGYSFNKYSILDGETALRKKQPFTIPLADWLSKPYSLPGPLKEIVLGDTVKRQGILDHRMMERLRKSISAENVGPQTLVSGADRVWSIIIFSLWYDTFLT